MMFYKEFNRQLEKNSYNKKRMRTFTRKTSIGFNSCPKKSEVHDCLWQCIFALKSRLKGRSREVNWSGILVSLVSDHPDVFLRRNNHNLVVKFFFQTNRTREQERERERKREKEKKKVFCSTFSVTCLGFILFVSTDGNDHHHKERERQLVRDNYSLKSQDKWIWK